MRSIDTYEHKVGTAQWGAGGSPRLGRSRLQGAAAGGRHRRDRANSAIAGPQGEHMVVVENTPNVHNLVVCTLCSCYPWPVLGLPPVWYKSAPYRSRAVIDPRGVLRELGLDLPDDVEVRVWDSTAELRYLVLPRASRRHASSMSEEELAGAGHPRCHDRRGASASGRRRAHERRARHGRDAWSGPDPCTSRTSRCSTRAGRRACSRLPRARWRVAQVEHRRVPASDRTDRRRPTICA